MNKLAELHLFIFDFDDDFCYNFLYDYYAILSKPETRTSWVFDINSCYALGHVHHNQAIPCLLPDFVLKSAQLVFPVLG